MKKEDKTTGIPMKQCFIGDPRKGATESAKAGDTVFHTVLAELPQRLHGPYRIRAITCMNPRDDPHGLWIWPMVWLDKPGTDIPVPSTRIVKVKT